MNSDVYFPQIFLPQNLEHAKSVILSTDPNGEKWVWETEHTISQIISAFESAGKPLSSESVLIDYGCGVGRIAAGLIGKLNCTIIGVDISPGMLHYSFQYTNSPRFIPCPQSCFPRLINNGLRVDGAYSIWTLQHCLKPAEDLEFIERSLKPGGLFFAVNKLDRYLPVLHQNGSARFVDDGIDVKKIISHRFDQIADFIFPTEKPEDTMCGLFKRISEC
jgi:ubiquinone/menaquinone biosynthesis C-methylase UbiE